MIRRVQVVLVMVTAVGSKLRQSGLQAGTLLDGHDWESSYKSQRRTQCPTSSEWDGEAMMQLVHAPAKPVDILEIRVGFFQSKEL